MKVSEFRALVEELALNGIRDNAPSLYTGNNRIALGANPFLLWNNIDKYLSNDFCFLLEGSKLTWV